MFGRPMNSLDDWTGIERYCSKEEAELSNRANEIKKWFELVIPQTYRRNSEKTEKKSRSA